MSQRIPSPVIAIVLLWASVARAQDLEPRTYANTPVGLNFLVAAYGYTTGGVAFDASVPLENAEIDVHSQVFAYARSFGLYGRSGKFDAILPIAELSGSAELNGMPVEREVAGLADPRFRLSYNFFGAPAHTLAEHDRYPQDLLIGASLQVVVPLGQYNDDRAVNLGSHRWAFKPELGISKAIGDLTLDIAAGVAFYTDNHSFFGDSKREQQPIYSVQGHAIYTIMPGVWIAFDTIWYGGGRSTVDGDEKDDEQGSLRLGGTLSLPITRRNSIKLHASGAVVTGAGTDFTNVGFAWQYRWGGGL